MKEIETKIINIDFNLILKRLKQINARKVFDSIVESIYFKAQPYLLRIRKIGNVNTLTLKVKDKKTGSIKVMDEYEVEVSDFDTMRTILNLLGYKEYIQFKKRRIHFKLNNVSFELDKMLDEYNHIPWFLEIEAQNKEDIDKYISLLGLNSYPRVDVGVEELIKLKTKSDYDSFIRALK